jgi:hypothetical protein
MDATAISLCMENGLPIIVFDLRREGNISRAAHGRADRNARPRRCGMTVETALADALDRMKKAVSVLHEELGAIRTGRATPAILSRITVDYYGTQVPINQLASFSVPEPRLLVVQPFDKNAISASRRPSRARTSASRPRTTGT